MAPESPMVASWDLGLRLRERRELAGMTAAVAGKHAGCTQGFISDVERGKTKIDPKKLDALLSVFEFSPEEIDELRTLREAVNQRAWWQAYTGIFDPNVLRYFGYEHGAEAVQTFDGLLIPGLLQTEDYARALFRRTPNYRLSEQDPRIEARLTRQRRLADPDPLRLTAVINEGVLRQQVGGPAVLRSQLRHLADVVERHRDTVELRVVPFVAGGYDALGGSTFHLLDFPGARLPSLLYQESLTMTDIVERPSMVRAYTYALREALDVGLSTQESLALVRRAETEL